MVAELQLAIKKNGFLWPSGQILGLYWNQQGAMARPDKKITPVKNRGLRVLVPCRQCGIPGPGNEIPRSGYIVL